MGLFDLFRRKRITDYPHALRGLKSKLRSLNTQLNNAVVAGDKKLVKFFKKEISRTSRNIGYVEESQKENIAKAEKIRAIERKETAIERQQELKKHARTPSKKQAIQEVITKYRQEVRDIGKPEEVVKPAEKPEEKWYKFRLRGGVPTFKSGVKGGGKLAGRGAKWSLGRVVRGGMSKPTYRRYKSKKAEATAEYRVQTGRYLTPSQSFYFKVIVALALILGFGFYFGFGFMVILFVIGGILLYFIFGPRYAVAFVIVGLIVYSIFYTAVGGAVFEKYGVSLEPIFEKFIIAGKLQASQIKAKMTGVGDWRNPYAVEKTVKKGIKIEKVSGFKDTFFPDDEIEIVGEGIAYGIEKRSATIRFGCSLFKDGKWVIGEIKEKDELLYLEPNEDEDFTVKCSFKELNFKVTEEAIYPKVKFVALYYNFGTNASLKLYTLDEDKKEIFKKPFETFKIRDDFLDYDKRTTRNIYDFGPLKISMHVANKQPLTTNEEYLLKLGIDVDRLNWMGNLTDGLIKLYFPENINVITTGCKTGIEIKDGMTKYCEFEFDRVEDGISFVDIKANAVYGYEFSKEGSITVVKKA